MKGKFVLLTLAFALLISVQFANGMQRIQEHTELEEHANAVEEENYQEAKLLELLKNQKYYDICLIPQNNDALNYEAVLRIIRSQGKFMRIITALLQNNYKIPKFEYKILNYSTYYGSTCDKGKDFFVRQTVEFAPVTRVEAFQQMNFEIASKFVTVCDSKFSTSNF